MKDYLSLITLVLIFVVIVFGGCLPDNDTGSVDVSRSDIKDYEPIVSQIEAEIGDIEWKSGEIAKIDDELLNENGNFYLVRLEERYFVIDVDKSDTLKVDVLQDITENGTYYLDEINGITYNAIKEEGSAYIEATSNTSSNKIIEIKY